MSTQQPEALRLAEILELGSRQFNKEAAAELRRLTALNAELLRCLQNLVDVTEHLKPCPGTLAQAYDTIAKAEGREA